MLELADVTFPFRQGVVDNQLRDFALPALVASLSLCFCLFAVYFQLFAQGACEVLLGTLDELQQVGLQIAQQISGLLHPVAILAGRGPPQLKCRQMVAGAAEFAVGN